MEELLLLKSNTSPWVFLTSFKLNKWYQVTQASYINIFDIGYFSEYGEAVTIYAMLDSGSGNILVLWNQLLSDSP